MQIQTPFNLLKYFETDDEVEQWKEYRTSNYLFGTICKFGGIIGALVPVDRIFTKNHPLIKISDVNYCGLDGTADLTTYVSGITVAPLSLNINFNNYNLTNYIGFIFCINFKFTYI